MYFPEIFRVLFIFAAAKLMNGNEEYNKRDEDIVSDTVVVRLTGFSASSIDIFVRYYTKTTNYNDYLEICEKLNLKIIDIMAKNGVQFAFPSTTVYFGDKETEQPQSN